MINDAIVLVGGLGKRLGSITKNIPKPMFTICEKPFIEYILDYLRTQSISKVVLAAGYKYEVIQKYFGSKYLELNIEYSIEDYPLGTGGGIKKAMKIIDGDDVFILNGDSFFNIDLNKLFVFHKSKKANLTLALKIMENYSRYGTVKIDYGNRVRGFMEKQYFKKGLINGGVYLAKTTLFDNGPVQSVFSFEKHFIEKYNNSYKFYGLPFEGYFCDIGTIEDLEKVKGILGTYQNFDGRIINELPHLKE